jgi:hypothetical protein
MRQVGHFSRNNWASLEIRARTIPCWHTSQPQVWRGLLTETITVTSGCAVSHIVRLKGELCQERELAHGLCPADVSECAGANLRVHIGVLHGIERIAGGGTQ